MKNRFAGHDHCAYPNGAFCGGTADILELSGRLFTSCRTIYQGQPETVPASDARKLRVIYVSSGVSLATVIAAVDDARQSRDWLILVFHRFADVPTVTTEWPTADFATLVEHVAASGLPVHTVSEVLAP